MRKEVEVDGKVYYVCSPTKQDERLAKQVSNRTFREALTSGAYLKNELYTSLKERGYFETDSFKKLSELQNKLDDAAEELKSLEGDAKKEKAKEMQEWRAEQLILNYQHSQLDNYTVEAQADDAYFDALVCQCVKDEEGNRVFSSYEDYCVRSDEPCAEQCAKELFTIVYGVAPDWYKNTPEGIVLNEDKTPPEESEETEDKEDTAETPG